MSVIDFFEYLASSGRHAFVPVHRLKPAAAFIQHFCGYTVGQRRARKRSRRAIPKKLLGWDGKAEFNEAPIGRGVAYIDAPAAERGLSTIADICPVQRPQAHCDAVLPGSIGEIQAMGAGAFLETEFG